MCGRGRLPPGVPRAASVLREDERGALHGLARGLGLDQIRTGAGSPAGGVAHFGALFARSHSTACSTLAPAGTFSSTAAALRGQSLEDHTSSSSPPASVTVSTAAFGPKSALHAADEVLVAISRNFGFSPGP